MRRSGSSFISHVAEVKLYSGNKVSATDQSCHNFTIRQDSSAETPIMLFMHTVSLINKEFNHKEADKRQTTVNDLTL